MTPETFRNALILTGPTGSGKSRLALELAPALDAEVVCMDSMTLYRGMDVGTAKPSAGERAAVPHHLLDVLQPHESSSVAWWLAQAADAVRAIEARGKVALFVGGTPLYLKALLFGLFDGPPADAAVRGRLEAAAREEGNAALHARLAAVDPTQAAKLHPNDVRRVVRALEVYESTGRPMSLWQTQWAPAESPPDEGRCLWLDLPREGLYRRIDARVAEMVAAGWVEEADRLRRLEPPPGREASQALGYKELADHLDGKATLAEAVALIRQRTRNFAKRQLAWFRHLPGCRAADETLTRRLWSHRIEGSGGGGGDVPPSRPPSHVL